MSFDLSRRFDGTEVIKCQIVLWEPSALFKSKSSGSEKMMHRAPHADAKWFGLEGKWKSSEFLLDPRQNAIKIGNVWTFIDDIDAASQFPVEKEHAVAFPYENKQVYVSGHVGLHIHCESTGKAFSMAFPNYELADVAFDAINRLSYVTLSHHLFSDSEGDSDDNDNFDDENDDNTTDDSSTTSPAPPPPATATPGGSSKIQKKIENGTIQLQLPKRLQRKQLSPVEEEARNKKKQQQKLEKIRQREMAKQRRQYLLEQQRKSTKHQEDENADDDNFVASSGSELIDRGRGLQLINFTTHFLQGGGMGSLTEEAAANGSGGGPKGPPSNGMIRVRKDTGTLSTWIARLEPGDDEHVYFLKLSKAMIKKPINSVISRAIPSVAQYLGPVVPLRFDSLTVRSESFRSEFYLEEVYTDDIGDKRIHRLICVFNSLEDRIRWEDWLSSRGVVRKAIETDKDQATKKSGGANAEAEGGAEGGTTEKGSVEPKNTMDTTMQLVNECFRLDEVWARPKPLRKADRRADEGGNKNKQNKSITRNRSYGAAGSSSFGPYQEGDDEGIVDDDDDEEEEEEDYDYEDDGTQSLPFTADSPKMIDGQVERVGGKTPRGLNNNSIAGFENFSFAGTALARSRELASTSSSGSASQKKKRASTKDGRNSPEPAKPKIPEKTEEELLHEQEALERCRWIVGTPAGKKTKWAALSETLSKEKSAGASFFSAIKRLKENAPFTQAEDAGTMHVGASSLNSSNSAKSDSAGSKLSAILRARQLKKAMDTLEEAERRKAEGNQAEAEKLVDQVESDVGTNSPTFRGQIAAIRDLNAIEAAADEEEGKNVASEARRDRDGNNNNNNICDNLEVYDQSPARNRLLLQLMRDGNSNPDNKIDSLRSGYPSISVSQPGSPARDDQAQNRNNNNNNNNNASLVVSPIAPEKPQQREVIIPFTHNQSQQQNISRTSQNHHPSYQEDRNYNNPNMFTSPSNYSSATANGNGGGVIGSGSLSLFGGPLTSKFPQISLRSQGYVEDTDIAEVMLRRATMEAATEGTSLQNLINNKNNNESKNLNNITSSVVIPTPSGQQKPQYSYYGSGGAHSPAADEARKFSFGVALSPPSNNNNNNTSVLFSSPKGTLMGDFSGARRTNHPDIQTSSDDDDNDGVDGNNNNNNTKNSNNSPGNQNRSSVDGNDLFAKARAMRAVTQLGEEFVGIGFDGTPSGRRGLVDGGMGVGSGNAGASLPGSKLASHLAPCCPLCGANRGNVAICRKTGRLHAAYTPSFAAGK